MNQSPLFEHEFRTARPPRPVYCHQEFLDKLAARRNEPVGKRTAMLLQRMAVDIARLHYKTTSGINRGWRRSRLGGGSGSHFYAWWAPAGAAPLQHEAAFQGGTQAIFLRDIRHHDDHAPLSGGSFANDYMPLSVPDLRGGEYAPEPWTSNQSRFARARGVVRTLKGHPGSGKTTALLHAADASLAERVLYLTFSQDLAGLARDYFDRFCSGSRTFTVLTYSEFLRQLLDGSVVQADVSANIGEGRAQFRRDLWNHQRSLGPWANELDALYDEIHAHVVGAAVPEKTGRFPKAERLRLPEEAYRAQRLRYLGPASASVFEAVRRLERAGDAPLADRYFPELALAWRAAHALASEAHKVNRAFLDYGCLAVDEVQDLTPLEAFVVLALGRLLNKGGRQAPILLAGDEAQTVRPTDFEWAWLNDMLHAMFGQPQEFKLPVNLRSPRRIAELVNRTWDFYDFLHKQDRPSGTGYAEIDDDAPDQILYAALPPAELLPLVTELSQREGLALIAFDKSKLPQEAASFVLTPAEAKGLDFHSVCVVNGGLLVRRIVDNRHDGAADTLAKRLAIDQLRVALSRPTERLIWMDTSPDSATVQEVGRLLSAYGEISLPPMTGEALRASLQEEELDVEERIQRCQKDARQLVSIKPDLAWSRAHQAVALLGTPSDITCVLDPSTRAAAYMTLAEVCCQLAIRKQKLSGELGGPDLYEQATQAARFDGKFRLGSAVQSIGVAERGHGAERLNQIVSAVQLVTEARAELPGWLLVELMPRASAWLEELDRHLDAGDNALLAHQILPPFFDAVGFPDAAARKERLARRSVQILMSRDRYPAALSILESLPGANQKLMAECYEQTGQFAKAAEIYLEQGESEKALKCYRSAPDFASALNLVRQMENHAAKPSLEWLAELEAVLARRPDNFSRVMTPPEKKLLESLLERGLGVQRKKPAAPKKAAAKTAQKTSAPKKRANPPRQKAREGTRQKKVF
ncbi:MAG TPA: hypothetical protein VIY49_00145 [Bryobacteraceae bacterium]